MSDQKKPIRQKLLQDFCRKKGWERPDGGWDYQAIFHFFNESKSTTKLRDLLNGNGTFGPQIARDLEDESNNELPPFSLDGSQISKEIVDWPFSKQLEQVVQGLDAEGLFRAENLLRHHFGIDPLPRPLGGFPAEGPLPKVVNDK